MKVPAIRASIGDWVYYTSTLTFKQVSDHVVNYWEELCESELLKDMLQRAITENHNSIADYIKRQDERFFNSLVLAVYDGEPQWKEVRLEYENGDEFYDLGVLELTGAEVIFPVDGQHRVEGIKKVVSGVDDYDNEKIPVIFIGHKNDDNGKQRTRRLFNTLNRYAKPVSLRDIIALDEDDSVAIACRDLIDKHSFFTGKRVLDSKSKSISENNNEFTTIISLYECNSELLWLYIKDKIIYDSKTGKKISTRNKKIDNYLRIRPNDEEINEFIMLCSNFWTDLSEHFDDLREYKNQTTTNSSNFRSKRGGSLFFRPTALIALVRTFVLLKREFNCTFKDAFKKIDGLSLELDSDMWRNILWDPVKKTMKTSNSKAVEHTFIYCVDKELLTKKEIDKLKKELQSILQADDEDVVCAYLNKFELG